jgi:hypothetical protein
MRLFKVCGFAIQAIWGGVSSAGRKGFSKGISMEGLAFITLISIFNADAGAGQFWSEDPVTNTLIISSNALILVDWAQTRYGANRPDQFEETGWAKNFTGRRPTSGDVTRYNLGALVLMNTAGYFLPEKAETFGMTWNPKKSLYFTVTSVQAHTVHNNAEVGVKLEW